MPTRRIADPFAQQIGSRIRDLRLEQRKSLEALEAACGVSRGHLSSIERGFVLMNVVTMRKIAGALGVRISELFVAVESQQECARRSRASSW